VLDFLPAPGSSITLTGGTASIGASYGSGSVADAISLTNCTISGSPLFGPVVTTPSPMLFLGATGQSGSIGLTCDALSTGGTGTLTCARTLNELAPVNLIWNLICPTAFLPPSVTYAPVPTTTVVLSGPNVIGEIDTARVDITINTDGVGSGPQATTSVSNCTSTGEFVAMLTPAAGVVGVGAGGGAGNVQVACVAAATPLSGSLSCEQSVAGSTTIRTWPLQCQAGRPIAVFSDGFEP
jgi:hypothetical protein